MIASTRPTVHSLPAFRPGPWLAFLLAAFCVLFAGNITPVLLLHPPLRPTALRIPRSARTYAPVPLSILFHKMERGPNLPH